MRFRTEDGCDCTFKFVCFEKGERVHDSQAEKDFEDMMNDAVEFEDLRFNPKHSAYVISGEQEQFLRGAAAGFLLCCESPYEQRLLLCAAAWMLRIGNHA